MQKFAGILVILISFGVECCWSDDLDSAIDSPPYAHDSESSSDIILAAKRQFERLKERGTVWLKTQTAMNQLVALEKHGKLTEARKVAARIVRDCQLIDNQLALERARYLLSTLESSALDDDALEQIRARLMAADGAGSLALAKSSTRAANHPTLPETK